MTQRPKRPDESTKSILITVDLEDWFQVENLRPSYPHEIWGSCEIRIEKNTHLLLDLFDRHNVQTTFFVLGWLAGLCPEIVRTIEARGHEVASHGFNHQLCSDLSQTALREDILRSKTILEGVTGKPVLGYRAPSFSVTATLIDILSELGFIYDSSYNSFSLNNRHGKANGLFSVSSKGHISANNGIVELPMSNLNIAGMAIPWSGGGYFRFWPSTVFNSGVSRILKNDGYYMFYCHPWEFDPEQPRANGIGALNRFRHYLNLDKTFSRLDQFLSTFKACHYVSCSSYLRSKTP